MSNGDFKNRSWVKDNIMPILVAGMFAAFWVHYETNRSDDRQDTKEFRQIVIDTNKKFNNRQLTVCQILIENPNTDPYYREMLKEWIRLETRGNTN